MNDAAMDERFIYDEHISQNYPKSILCTQIKHKGVMTGILYLENNLTSNVSTPERLALLQILSAQAAISIENARLIDKVTENAVLQKEIEMAQKIQQSLLPKSLPEIKNIQIAFKYEPMRGIGGDFVSFHHSEDKNYLGIFICDVSGHGVPGALTASMVSMALDFLWDANIESPSKILYEMKKQLKGKMGGNYFTACLCSLNLNDNTMTFSSAGHPPFIIARCDGKVEMVKTTGRLIIDYYDSKLFDKTLQLQKGDRIILYTDGITEAMNLDYEMLGDDDNKFMNWINEILSCSSTPSSICDQIYSEIIKYTKKDILKDDFTIVVFEYVN